MALPLIAGVVSMGASVYRTATIALVGAFGAALPEIAKRIAYALGVGAVVFIGLDTLMSQISVHALGTLNGMPGLALNIAGLLEIDTAFNIVMSAYSIKLTIRTLGNASAAKQIGLRSAG